MSRDTVFKKKIMHACTRRLLSYYEHRIRLMSGGPSELFRTCLWRFEPLGVVNGMHWFLSDCPISLMFSRPLGSPKKWTLTVLAPRTNKSGAVRAACVTSWQGFAPVVCYSSGCVQAPSATFPFVPARSLCWYTYDSPLKYILVMSWFVKIY